MLTCKLKTFATKYTSGVSLGSGQGSASGHMCQRSTSGHMTHLSQSASSMQCAGDGIPEQL